eukprot:Gb_05093 [translate_table: standard]
MGRTWSAPPNFSYHSIFFAISPGLIRSFLFSTSSVGGFSLTSNARPSIISSTFSGSLQASITINMQSAFTAAVRTFVIIMASNLCIFF